jgi:hypothetical protein
MHEQPNGAAAPQVIQINPAQAANLALMFLDRDARIAPREREQYGIAESLLRAIAAGNVQIVPAQAAPAAEPPTLKEAAT